VGGPRIIEPEFTTHCERYGSSNYRHHSHNFIWPFLLTLDGHKVRQFGYSFFCKKARNKDVCIRQIELTNPHISQLGCDLKAASLFFIEQGRKHGRRIEVWITKKIDGTVHADQRGRLHVANHAVILNRLEGHTSKEDYAPVSMQIGASSPTRTNPLGPRTHTITIMRYPAPPEPETQG
jgi:hypothetical protein